MQEHAHETVVYCSSLDTGLCQDPGTGARFYITGEDLLCFSLSDCMTGTISRGVHLH